MLFRSDEDRRVSATDQGPASRVHGRVLLVDQSLDHLRLLGKMLTHAGAQVSTASNGELALHLLAATTFDLVFIEMQMSGLDGYTTVQRLRESGMVTPVIALTSATGPGAVERCLAAGCNGHIAKPVDHEQLLRALSMHLQNAAG